jgi:hypothetical protein
MHMSFKKYGIVAYKVSRLTIPEKVLLGKEVIWLLERILYMVLC